MRDQMEAALTKFVERPTSANKEALERLIHAYPDFFIEGLGQHLAAQPKVTIEPEIRMPLARTRYTDLPFGEGGFVLDSDVFPIDAVPEGHRVILHFRLKQEFRGQTPFGVVTLRTGTSTDANDKIKAGKFRRGYKDSEGNFWVCSKETLLDLVGSKTELRETSSLRAVESSLKVVQSASDVPDSLDYRHNWLHPFLMGYDDYRVEDAKDRFLTSRAWGDVGSNSSANEIQSGSEKLGWLEQFCTPEEEWVVEPTWKDFLVDLEAGDPESPLGAQRVRKVCLVNSQFPSMPVTIRTLTLDQTVRGGTPIWGDGPMPEDPNDRWIIENSMPDMSPQFFRRLAYFLDCTFES